MTSQQTTTGVSAHLTPLTAVHFVGISGPFLRCALRVRFFDNRWSDLLGTLIIAPPRITDPQICANHLRASPNVAHDNPGRPERLSATFTGNGNAQTHCSCNIGLGQDSRGATGTQYMDYTAEARKGAAEGSSISDKHAVCVYFGHCQSKTEASGASSRSSAPRKAPTKPDSRTRRPCAGRTHPHCFGASLRHPIATNQPISDAISEVRLAYQSFVHEITVGGSRTPHKRTSTPTRTSLCHTVGRQAVQSRHSWDPRQISVGRLTGLPLPCKIEVE